MITCIHHPLLFPQWNLLAWPMANPSQSCVSCGSLSMHTLVVSHYVDNSVFATYLFSVPPPLRKCTKCREGLFGSCKPQGTICLLFQYDGAQSRTYMRIGSCQKTGPLEQLPNQLVQSVGIYYYYNCWLTNYIGRSKGDHGGHIPPGCPNSFNFMQLSGEFCKIVCSRTPPPRVFSRVFLGLIWLLLHEHNYSRLSSVSALNIFPRWSKVLAEYKDFLHAKF